MARPPLHATHLSISGCTPRGNPQRGTGPAPIPRLARNRAVRNRGIPQCAYMRGHNTTIWAMYRCIGITAYPGGTTHRIMGFRAKSGGRYPAWEWYEREYVCKCPYNTRASPFRTICNPPETGECRECVHDKVEIHFAKQRHYSEIERTLRRVRD